MTIQEARKVIGLNIHNLNGSMQMAVATIMDALEKKAEIIGYLQPSEDLEEEIDSFWNKASGFSPKFTTLEVKRNGLGVIARHFAEWQKQQMLKDAAMVEGNVLELGETYKDLTISVEGKELNEVLQPLGVEDGDKVEIIIVPENKEDSWQSARRAAKTLGKMNLGIKFFGNLFPYLRKRGKLDGCCKLSHRGKTPVWLYDTEGIAELINEGKLEYKPKD